MTITSETFDDIADALRACGGARNVTRERDDDEVIATLSRLVANDSVVGAVIIRRTLFGLEAALSVSAPVGFDGLDARTHVTGLDPAAACVWATCMLALVVSHVESVELIMAGLDPASKGSPMRELHP